jgi:hypothetical protein
MLLFLMLSFDVIISRSLQMLSFLCYHFSLYSMGVIILCYHLMFSFIVIISPLFSFSWNVTHSIAVCIFRFKSISHLTPTA